MILQLATLFVGLVTSSVTAYLGYLVAKLNAQAKMAQETAKTVSEKQDLIASDVLNIRQNPASPGTSLTLSERQERGFPLHGPLDASH